MFLTNPLYDFPKKFSFWNCFCTCHSSWVEPRYRRPNELALEIIFVKSAEVMELEGPIDNAALLCFYRLKVAYVVQNESRILKLLEISAHVVLE